MSDRWSGRILHQNQELHVLRPLGRAANGYPDTARVAIFPTTDQRLNKAAATRKFAVRKSAGSTNAASR
jgi:hypothetical protein